MSETPRRRRGARLDRALRRASSPSSASCSTISTVRAATATSARTSSPRWSASRTASRSRFRRSPGRRARRRCHGVHAHGRHERPALRHVVRAARARGGREPTAIGLSELAAGVDAGLQGIQRLGGAKPGDKTMVDALAPASAALAEAAAADVGLASGLAAAATAARAGADATAPMLARRGRASYVGEAARGVLRPGRPHRRALLRSRGAQVEWLECAICRSCRRSPNPIRVRFELRATCGTRSRHRSRSASVQLLVQVPRRHVRACRQRR